MKPVTDPEISAMVQRVLHQLMGRSRPAEAPAPPEPAAQAAPKPADRKVVAIGADHGGFDLKEILKAELSTLGHEVIDVGTCGKEAVDYPDIAREVAHLVGVGKAWRGVMIDGAGIGSCIVANKVPGIRAGLAYDHSSAVNSREHNDTNVLTLGAGLIGVNLARHILQTWLATPFGGGRHKARVEKIIAIEKLYLK